MATQDCIRVKFDDIQSLSSRVTLVERLQRLYGVESAIFDSDNYLELAVCYRDGSLSPDTLLNFLERQKMPAKLLDSGLNR
ncbi:MAG TPA: hypothetical protein PKK10_14740 [Woeseiaceae bacterium]|nr:hypothetical protein [Woeseiaceae bacterium]